MEPVLTTKNGRIFEIWELLERVCENPGGAMATPLPPLADAHVRNLKLVSNDAEEPVFYVASKHLIIYLQPQTNNFGKTYFWQKSFNMFSTPHDNYYSKSSYDPSFYFM